MAQPRRVAAWDFDGPAPAGSGLASATGTRVPGIRGHALRAAPGAAPLLVPAPEREGRIRFDPVGVAMRFWYRPDWSSRGVGTGQGPGGWARLLVVGDRERRPEEGWMEIGIHPDGTQLEVATGSGSGPGKSATYASLPVRFTAGTWTELVLNLFPAQVSGFMDGAVVLDHHPNGVPGPSLAAQQRGMALGGRGDGTQTAQGALDELEFFDAPLGRVEANKRGQVLSASPMAGPDGLRLEWRLTGEETVEISRAELGTTNWTRLGRVSGRWDFEDVQVKAGQAYSYRLVTNSRPARLDLVAGLRLPPVEDRGAVAVLVDDTMVDPLRLALDQLERDLVADGWRVVRRAVPRHDDRNWAKNLPAIAGIRNFLRSEWEDSGRTLRAVYLVGHVAIPYSGMRAEDVHTGKGDNHWGAWPADHYYADLDGIWTDRLPYPDYLSKPTFPETYNVPGDGKWDTEWVAPNAAGDTRLELAFGRIDFVRMPAFVRTARGEADRVRQYLEKVHRYRGGGISAEPRAVVGLYLGHGVDLEILKNAWRAGSSLFGPGQESLFEGDLFELPEGRSAAWGFQSGGGGIDRVRIGTPRQLTTASLIPANRQPRVLFAMLLGSWFGDWAVGENNLLRAITASRDYGLAAMWVRYTEWRYDPLARGGTLGDAQLLTANESIRQTDPAFGTTRTLTILGDPTLRQHVVEPPRSVRGERRAGEVRLGWQMNSNPADLGQLVYRSATGWRGPYRRLTSEPIRSGEFVDSEAPPDAVYLVRTARLVETGCGSYTNLSQGVFWPGKTPPDRGIERLRVAPAAAEPRTR